MHLMNQTCPYCAIANKTGELYCSRHGSEMTGLKSGLFFINRRKFELCDPHVTRLSLNFNLDSDQTYQVGHRSFKVSPHDFLVINEGQSFRTSSSDDRSRMITLAYEVGLPQSIASSLSTQWDQPCDNARAQGGFFEQTMVLTENFRSAVFEIINVHESDPERFDELLESALVYALTRQSELLKTVLSFGHFKPSTRIEIHRRLQLSVEYAKFHFHIPISVENLAQEACISVFHYKRLFKQMYQISPYKYVRQLRLTKAKELLSQGESVSDVCHKVGWENTSSFIRLFKSTFGMTPMVFRGK